MSDLNEIMGLEINGFQVNGLDEVIELLEGVDIDTLDNVENFDDFEKIMADQGVKAHQSNGFFGLGKGIKIQPMTTDEMYMHQFGMNEYDYLTQQMEAELANLESLKVEMYEYNKETVMRITADTSELPNKLIDELVEKHGVENKLSNDLVADRITLDNGKRVAAFYV